MNSLDYECFENSMFSTFNIPDVSVGLGKECEDVNLFVRQLEGWTAIKIPYEGSFNLHSGWSFPDCVKKSSHQNGDYQLYG